MVIALTVALVEDTVLRAMKHAVVDVLEVYVIRKQETVQLGVSITGKGPAVMVSESPIICCNMNTHQTYLIPKEDKFTFLLKYDLYHSKYVLLLSSIICLHLCRKLLMCNFIFILVPLIQSPDSDDTTIIYIATAIICVLIIAVAIGL